ncbi:MAG TPA: type II secretion system protein GspD, partial [bacterium (Candidatus Stahlbacteria)]|nr:type II secretion system protein GspD [Candidatus Stahlbacteria bacterium]
EGKITIHLEKVPLGEALDIMCRSHGLELLRKDNYYLIKKGELGELELEITENRITVRARDVPIRQLVDSLSIKSGMNIVVDRTAEGTISGSLKDVDLAEGLKTLLAANGLLLKRVGGIYYVSKPVRKRPGRTGLSVTVTEGKFVSLDVANADLGDVLDEIATQADINIVRYGEIRGIINARLDHISLDKALTLIFQGTKYTFKKTDDIYLVGDKSITSPAASALTTAKLIPLFHIKADLVPSLLPQTIPRANVKLVKEQNAVLVFGTEDIVKNAEEFIKTIDIESPQVLIEAMIVEVSRSATKELGVRAGLRRPDTTHRTIIPQIRYTAGGDEINWLLDTLASYLHLRRLGFLPKNFWLYIHLLESRGKARVRANPKIATLNGNEASINVGWVRYYRTTTGTVENPIYQLHAVDAGIKLKIIPWVSSAGEITTVIQTEVSNLKSIGPEGLPEIAKRTAATTIRLKNGETVMIGGLIQKSKLKSKEQIPILGSIPILGNLFSFTTSTEDETELIIYITPRILTGGIY